MKTINVYHFRGSTLRNGLAAPPIGEWLRHKGSIEPCQSGLHGSEHPFDALQYAPEETPLYLDLCELRGDLQSHGNPTDKWVGRERRILATIDADALCREAACSWALDVAHMWDMPPIVRQYLETQDANIRAAAWSAAWAARSAAGSAWAAARAAAGSAARAARSAARAAVWSTGAAAEAARAARSAAWLAAWAARSAAAAAARSAGSAAWAAQREDFELAVISEFIAKEIGK